MGLGLAGIILSDGRWMYALAVIGILAFWIYNQNQAQQKEWQATQANNKPLQENCISNTKNTYNQRVANLRNQGVFYQNTANNEYNAYQMAISNCNIKYPTY